MAEHDDDGAQRLADGIESDALVRYRRRQELVTLLDEAARRADALHRLESLLRQPRGN